MKYTFLLYCFVVLTPCMMYGLDEKCTPITHAIIKHLYEEHAKAHNGMPNPQTTFYAATIVDGVNITSAMPADGHGVVELSLMVLSDTSKRSDLRDMLLLITREQQQVLLDFDDEREPKLCERIAEILRACIHMHARPYHQQSGASDKTISLDDNTTLILPANSSKSPLFKTIVAKNVLDNFSLKPAQKSLKLQPREDFNLEPQKLDTQRTSLLDQDLNSTNPLAVLLDTAENSVASFPVTTQELDFPIASTDSVENILSPLETPKLPVEQVYVQEPVAPVVAVKAPAPKVDDIEGYMLVVFE